MKAQNQPTIAKESPHYNLITYRPGSSGYETNYDRRPSIRHRGTSSMEQSSSVRHRLLVSWHLQKISQDLFVFTVILEHRTAHYTDSVKRPRSSFPPLTTL